MNNSTSPDNSGGSDGGGGSSDALNWVALVVSLVALVGTLAQVLQQYIASAAGYSNCGESVMGKWHESKKRIFRPTELRFEVQFETPVIFVCPATNKNGPVRNQPIHFIDGTSESLRKTRALLPKEEEAQRQTLQEGRVHTADNERASWVTLLSQLQSMEKESQEWQQQHYKNNPPQPFPPADFRSHTLAVALQAKKRSWDTMPADVRKPYATTTICHLLEIAAMMGIYWKEFDRSGDRYRAEGNGYMLTGTNVPELGLLFSFQICGKSKFRENRVIPVDEVKELCCGFVSTLFQDDSRDRRRIEFPNEDPKDLSFLQLGSLREIAETMVLIECNTDTANYFRSDDTKHGHLFPVPFELLGMLGKTLHIRNSAFRMLPNPTPYHWDKNFFNLRRLVKEYWKKIHDSEADLPPTDQVLQLENDAKDLLAALDADKRSKTPGNSLPLLNKLHDILDGCDAFLKAADRDLVRMVVREHFQEVLKLINDKSGPGVDADSRSTQSGGYQQRRAEHFDELTAASPEERQEAFMDLYFFKVLRKVRERAVMSYRRRQTTRYAPSVRSRAVSVDSVREATDETMSTPASATPSRPISPGPSPTYLGTQDGAQSTVPLLHVQPPDRATQPLAGMDRTVSLESQASAIWCTLVLRMLCWLLLHDFNKKDVQIPKSELLGSRQPVYIA
ncbi:uncharacterized protein THITE_2109360 [Thermothielavioides terrestris NRRL 8126]|uniref:Modin n=1 Tax=Thermothielavioides terrestris (strain ATCC 38088 / NRRL 8126) TaxID=578455 RepID=G2QUW9_THETT|nr:uncharacterized protein THITE_2109360 [Thermothielavioides terrestris NRRL 8126]AEO63764.1 hypothetical protein THITE_2109360 [Thermothielavioides terrestris NRRL 8126]